MPLRMPKPLFVERDDDRKLCDVLVADGFNDLTPSAVMGLIVFKTIFGLV